MSNADKIFSSTFSRPSGFNFDNNVANVFDNMLTRSVPFYKEMHRMVVELSINFVDKRTNVYDLGCSTGTLLTLLANAIEDKSVKFKGVDDSGPMLKKCRENLNKAKVLKRCSLIEADMNKGIKIENASVVIMILTLQFIRPFERDNIMKNIYNGLNNKGALILCEKILSNDPCLNSLYIELYHRFKERNGYSQLEIARKREALENILIPYQLKENIELLKRSGFKTVETFFRWYNFCGIIALK